MIADVSTVIIGAGEVGSTLARMLMHEGRKVIIVDRDEDRLAQVSEMMDVQVVAGFGASPRILEAAQVDKASLLIAVTDVDEVNMIATMTAKQLGCPKTVARIRNEVYLEGEVKVRYRDLLGIDLVISPEIVTAMKISQVVLTPGAVEVENFANNRVQLLQLQITDRCPILGEPLRSFPIPEGYLLTAIERGEELLIPRGDDTLEVGDRAWVSCIPERRNEAYRTFGTAEPPARRVAILGGGKIPLMIARALEKQGIEVIIFEEDYKRCHELSSELPRAHVIHGDGSDVDLLRDEGVESYDHFLGASTDDALNIVSTNVAKHLGVPRTLAIVERHGFAAMVEEMGVDTVVSPRILTASTILKYLRRGEIVSGAKIGEDKGEILEFVVQSGSAVVGKSLAEARIPKGAIVSAILKKDGSVKIPRGADLLNDGDHVILFALPSVIKEVERRFS